MRTRSKFWLASLALMAVVSAPLWIPLFKDAFQRGEKLEKKSGGKRSKTTGVDSPEYDPW